MIRIAIYARKSLFTGKGDSIGAQIDTCKRFIEFKFADQEYEIKIFQDEGWSGKTTDRPDFNRLYKDIKNKTVDYVLTYKLDRLGRTSRDLHNLLYELDKLGIVYLSATEPYDTTTSTGRFMITMLAGMAQMERERLAERVKGSMIQLSKKGRWLGGQTPLGFNSIKEKYIDDEGRERQLVRLSINNGEIEIVKLLYKKYLELNSLNQLRIYCSDHKITGKNGGDFGTSTLKQILTSPVYVKSSSEVLEYLKEQNINVYGKTNGNGILVFNKTKEIYTERDKSEWIAAVSKHKGVISSNDWLKIQSIITAQSEKKKESSGRTGTSNTALLSGILKCTCGNRMLVKAGHRSKTNTDIVYNYYVCGKKDSSYGLKELKCSNKNIRVDEADEKVIKALKVFNKDVLIKELENVNNKSLDFNNDNKSEISFIESSIADKEKAINNLFKKLSLIEDDSVSKLLLDQIKNINDEISELKIKLENIHFKKNETSKLTFDLESYILNLENFNNNIDYIEDINQKKQLISSIVSEIIWDGERLKIVPAIKKTSY